MSAPEELARQNIDALLEKCGWTLQNRSTINFDAARGVAIREALLKDRDEVDYLLLVDGKAIGTVEAKPEGFTLIGVEEQSGKYGKNLLDVYGKWRDAFTPCCASSFLFFQMYTAGCEQQAQTGIGRCASLQ